MSKRTKTFLILGVLAVIVAVWSVPFMLIGYVVMRADGKVREQYSEVIIPLCNSIEDDEWEQYMREDFIEEEGYDEVKRLVYEGFDDGKYCEDYKEIGVVRTIVGGGDYFSETIDGEQRVRVTVENRKDQNVDVASVKENGEWKVVYIYITQNVKRD